jgi:folate-binding protein YgfZ
MEKDQIIILEDRGLISITGEDAKEFMQNIITNDINKVSASNSIFSGLFTPQGKYLYEFFIIRGENGYFLDCDSEFSLELINHFSRHKLRSRIEIKNLSTNYAVGIISLSKFKEIQKINEKDFNTIQFRKSPLFLDPRKKEMGGRLLSSLEELYFIIKEFKLKICEKENYYEEAHSKGIPIKGLHYLKEQLFGLEANFEELKAIDFKKGCYIGQENTARMKLKNKIRKRLLPVKSEKILNIGDEVNYNNTVVGKILIDKPLPFALVKISEIDFSNEESKNTFINNKKVKLINLF